METVTLAGLPVEIRRVRVLVVGTGAAGYAAADRLTMLGVDGVVMITDHRRGGTSRNAGSDKQTYYKLTLAGSGRDSVREVAQTLFAGGAMDGDIALAEAASSARAFTHLVDAGVPFPHNPWGEFVGYKTDHDPRQRATSAGPYTSKLMVESLERRVRAGAVPIMESYRVVDLVAVGGHIKGVLTWDIDQMRYVLFRSDYVVYATGGPGGLYADSVYPHAQSGAHGAAFRAGVKGRNLTEWQFGLASVHPRWNVSGSYMQVIPRFFSVGPDEGDPAGGVGREFLAEAIPDPGALASLIFLKGYQWPFDIRKARGGSSLIDLLVYRETVMRGRMVFLDFRRNLAGYDPARLSVEARDYLQAAGIAGGQTPIERLWGLNRPAYDFYRERADGLDLLHHPLQIAVCAQHNNGGLAVDHWWQSNLKGFFPVGEAAGTHGVYRPGGAALNAGQVGALRAAMYIAHDISGATGADTRADTPEAQAEEEDILTLTEDLVASAQGCLGALADPAPQMSDHAGLLRTASSIRVAREGAWEILSGWDRSGGGADGKHLAGPAGGADGDRDETPSRRVVDRAFLHRDIVTTQYVYLLAMEDYLTHSGRSRGSVLYTDPTGELPTLPDGTPVDLPECFRFTTDDGALDEVIQEISWDGLSTPECTWRTRNPIPSDEEVFETVWENYRTTGNVE